jgi:hypothetical protein
VAEKHWDIATDERNHRIQTGMAIFCYLSHGGSEILQSLAAMNFKRKIERDLNREAAEVIRSLYQE